VTRRSSRLTDRRGAGDELLLLDVLFDADDTRESLRRANYGAWHNLRDSHGLDDAALARTVRRLRGAGLLRVGPRWLGLTPRGGALWSRARRPRWSRYCTDASFPTADGRWTLTVRSPSLATARAFLDVAVACGLYDADPGAASVLYLPRARLLPWRMFASVHELRVPLAGERTAPPDWDAYERRRVWWRTVAELRGTGPG
jgi:hypothetical protein